MKRVVVALVLAAFRPGVARAGSGPWSLSPDDLSLYVGGGYTRWNTIAMGDPSNRQRVDAPVTRSALTFLGTYGLVHGTEFELGTSAAWAGVNAEADTLCEPSALCETSAGFTPVRARLKARLLDELVAPLTVAAGVELRFGDFTAPGRSRLTALGDGQSDFGLFASAGRGGALGSAWSYGTYAEITGRRRLALTTVRGIKVPPDEIASEGEFLLYPTPNLSLGPAWDAVHALGGLDLGALPMDHPEVFTSLAVTSVKVGGKLNVRSTDNVTVSLSAFGTAYARNNPTDFFTVSVGVGSFTAGGGS